MAKKVHEKGRYWMMLSKYEDQIIRWALAQVGNGIRAAELLEVSYQFLYKKCGQLGIDLKEDSKRRRKRRTKAEMQAASGAPILPPKNE